MIFANSAALVLAAGKDDKSSVSQASSTTMSSAVVIAQPTPSRERQDVDPAILASLSHTKSRSVILHTPDPSTKTVTWYDYDPPSNTTSAKSTATTSHPTPIFVSFAFIAALFLC
ncbi:hypothetical protein DSO57_1015120 [Entomophthora muscae]|uniref:Uncharacterized protein n=1 Tax=Entomophthora muscae TaxID=34485 RepID=A0ACC2SU17_9FUNG|nr:hypothetical protein DSO57_1015120 [Entomophthora muscae]